MKNEEILEEELIQTPAVEVEEVEEVEVNPAPEVEEVVEETLPARDFEAELREAEERGYLRAKNELARNAINRPDLWQPFPEQPDPLDDEEASQLRFLSYIRPSVWD